MWSLTYVASPNLAWGSLTEVANAAAQSRSPIRLTECKSIQMAMRSWCHTHSSFQQHDGAEFCAEVLASLVSFHWGSYACRRSHDPPVKHDLKHPVQLQLPASVTLQQSAPVELQSLTLMWHKEHEWLQALTAPPAVLCLQVCRGTAPGTKSHVPVIMSGLSVQIPCYAGADLQVRRITY